MSVNQLISVEVSSYPIQKSGLPQLLIPVALTMVTYLISLTMVTYLISANPKAISRIHDGTLERAKARGRGDGERASLAFFG